METPKTVALSLLLFPLLSGRGLTLSCSSFPLQGRHGIMPGLQRVLHSWDLWCLSIHIRSTQKPSSLRCLCASLHCLSEGRASLKALGGPRVGAHFASPQHLMTNPCGPLFRACCNAMTASIICPLLRGLLCPLPRRLLCPGGRHELVSCHT